MSMNCFRDANFAAIAMVLCVNQKKLEGGQQHCVEESGHTSLCTAASSGEPLSSAGAGLLNTSCAFEISLCRFWIFPGDRQNPSPVFQISQLSLVGLYRITSTLDCKYTRPATMCLIMYPNPVLAARLINNELVHAWQHRVCSCLSFSRCIDRTGHS